MAMNLYFESPHRKTYLRCLYQLYGFREERVGIVQLRSLQPGVHACSVDAIGAKPQMRDSDVRE